MDDSLAKRWAELNFGKADLGHAARNTRARLFAAAMVRAPSVSIPKFCETKSEAKAAYEFLANPNIDHEALLGGHVRYTAELCDGLDTVLVVQDTTALSFGGRQPREGCGPVNDSSKAQGMLAHTALALREDGSVVGVLGQRVWARSKSKRARDESCANRKKRPRESENWHELQRQVARACEQWAQRPPRVVAVFDREGDIFEAFDALRELRHGFVIRATHNRLLVSEDGGPKSYSLDEARAAPVLTTIEVHVPDRPGQSERDARLAVRATSVLVQPPKNIGRKGEPIRMNIVLVEEVEPPTDKQSLRWFLLTSEPIDTVEQVLRVVQMYKARWLIEELHMGLKTGCSIEKKQMGTAHALQNFLAFATIVSVQMLQLRDAARCSEPKPATAVLTPVQLTILRMKQPKLPQDCTATQALRAVARLGGFMGTNKERRPGWRTLWGGYMRLLDFEHGFLLALAMLSGDS